MAKKRVALLSVCSIVALCQVCAQVAHADHAAAQATAEAAKNVGWATCGKICDNNVTATGGACIVKTKKVLKCPEQNARSVDPELGSPHMLCSCLFTFESLTIIDDGGIQCADNVLPFTPASCKPSLCELRFNITHTVNLTDHSFISASSIVMHAGKVQLSGGSGLNASFLGYPPILETEEKECTPLGQPSSRAGLLSHGGYGASHGGSGGQGGDISIENCNYHVYTDLSTSGGDVIGNASRPASLPFWDVEWGYSGTCSGNGKGDGICGGRGGGRINVTATKTLTISQNAFISADGAPSNTEKEVFDFCCGAGSGGTVVLNAESVDGSGIVSADGGAGSVTNARGGGGGGACPSIAQQMAEDGMCTLLEALSQNIATLAGDRMRGRVQSPPVSRGGTEPSTEASDRKTWR